MNRSEVISTSPLSKFELANSPYLESLSAPSFALGPKLRRKVAIADDLYQAISERKRAQSIVKELEHRIVSLQQDESRRSQHRADDPDRNSRGTHRSLPAETREQRQKWRDMEQRMLEEKRMKIKIANEEGKMRMEEQKEEMLQKKRVTYMQMNVLKLKESILQERRLSPSRRRAKRDRQPRFVDLPEIREPPRSTRLRELRMSSQSPAYDEQLRKEKEILMKLNQKITALSQEEKSLHAAKKPTAA